MTQSLFANPMNPLVQLSMEYAQALSARIFLGFRALVPKSMNSTTNAVAIVDDVQDICNLMSLVLSMKGYNVAFIGNSGEEIIEAIAEGKLTKDNLDVVLLDYHLGSGRIDGLKTASLLRELVPTAKIIIVTADSSIKAQVLASGMSFISKPFSIQEFLKIVREDENDDDRQRDCEKVILTLRQQQRQITTV